MPINTKESYIEIGTSFSNGVLENVLSLPVPIELPSSDEFIVDAGRNVDGAMLIEQIGRTQYTTQIKFARLKNTKWWEINRWIEANGMFFWCKYFAHNYGVWRIRRFYCGDPKCEPFKINPDTGIPEMYINCSINVIDMGEETTVTISTVQI